MMRCVKLQSNTKRHLKREDVENVTMTTSDKVNKNDNSPQSYQERPISSTPVTIKQIANNAEESPDFDYYASPILLPCTQEGNEVAWDWQDSVSKTPESRHKKRNVQCETPKGTKLLQRKRNSNSPLLYKPLKRKTMKRENMENIGQFAAELQALNERMRVIKQNDKNRANDHIEEEAPESSANTSNKEEISRIEDKEQNCKITKTNGRNTANRNGRSGSYDDLFDDSVDDDIIRCTQEIEEKFNMIMDKGNSMDSHANVKKEETSCTNDASNKNSVQHTSNKDSKELSYKHIHEVKTTTKQHEVTKNSNILKTYSKLPKRDANSSICATTQKGEDQHKSYLNNNNMIHSHARKPRDNKTLSKNNIAELFEFPDDSFDDCLATCIEDEKLLSGSIGSDDSLAHGEYNMKCETSYEHLTHAPLKSKADSLKSTTKIEKSSTIEKKFFKTKSLSDQYINQNAVTNVKSTANAMSSSMQYHTMRPTLRFNSTKSSHTNVTGTSVSTNPIVINDRKVENSAISLTRGTDRTNGFNVNRCAIKGDCDRFVRHHSTGNMKNNTKEMTKTGSQPVQCTAEEIEKKRLQALMRLEAKRKLFSEKIRKNINR